MDLTTRPNALADAFALEPRYMFDAAGAATGAEAAADAAAQDEAAQQAEAEAAEAEPTLDAEAAEDEALAEALALVPGDVPGDDTAPREVVIVDPSVADYETLLTDLDPAVEVILLPEAATLDDIATALAGETGIDALHVISHGGVGQIALGGQSIDGDFTAAEEAAWTAIGAALSETGDILLYGCEIGQGGEGTAFLEAIASLTGADVAASDDLTGAADLGGDWELEVVEGDVEATTPFSALALADFTDIVLSTVLFDFSAQPDTPGSGFIQSATVTSGGVTMTITAPGASPSQGFYFYDGYIGTLGGGIDELRFSFDQQIDLLSFRLHGSSTVENWNISSSKGAIGEINDTPFSFEPYSIAGVGAWDSGPIVGNAQGISQFTVNFDGAQTRRLDDITIELSDSIAPTLTSIERQTPAVETTDADTLTFRATFSEAVQNVTAADFVVSGTSATITGVNQVNGSTYDLTVSGGDLANLNGTVGLNVAGGQDITDAAGNAFAGAEPGTDQTYTLANNAAPTITLPATPTVSEDSSNNAIDNAIQIADADASDTQTVTLTAANGTFNVPTQTGLTLNSGSYNSGSVEFSGSLTDVNAALDSLTFTPTAGFNGAASIQVQTNDGNSGTDSETLNITVQSQPDVTGIAVTGTDGNLAIGETVTVTVTFDEAVQITSGTPSIGIEVGGNNRNATYVSGTGSTQLVFTYDIQAGDGTDTEVTVRADTLTGNIVANDDSAASDLTHAATTETGIDVDAVPPTVTDGNISLSGGSGTGGAFVVGDTVTATWNNTAGGDNNGDISGVTVDFSEFGGGAAVAATNSSGTWTATYTIVAGAIDATNRNVSVTATDNAGNQTTTADTGNATVDSQAPTVTDGNISISGGSGTGGAFVTGDTVTATWNNTAGGDNNADTIAGVTVDFSQFGGGAAVAATNSSGTWTATYTIVAGAIDATNRNVSVTATDNAGNQTTTADTGNATVDSQAPTVTDGNISISGGSGTGGAFVTGDTVTATWNNTAGGDNNADTIAGVTVDFSQFGGGAAVAATPAGGTWTATYTIVAGAIDAGNRNVSVTATDDAGNQASVADSTNATVDNQAPTVTDGNISIAGAGSGTGGVYVAGDTIAVSWDNSGTGDNNGDTIAGVTVDFSAFGGGAAVAATNTGGVWSASYTVTAGTLDGTGLNASVTATDNAGNATTTADTSNLSVDNQVPAVTDLNISISGGSGTGGAFVVGDTVTATWNNTAGGDNNADTIAGVTVDFSQFGGGAAVLATNSSGTWTATYTIVAGAIDATNRNVTVTATDNAGNATTTADTTNATVDAQAPTVTDGNISISGGSGTGGAFIVGDTVTATWNNTAGGDNNADIIAGVTVDFSQFGGGAAVAATESSGSWTATYTIVAGAIDTANRNVSVTATDNAGNATTTADTFNATVDSDLPAIDGAIAPSVATIRDAQVGTNGFTLTIDFDEAMDTGVAPTVTFPTGGEDPSNTLTANGGSWTDSNTYVARFNVVDVNEVVGAIDVRIAGAQDAAGNPITAVTQTDIFSIVTAPSPTVQAITSAGGNNTYGVGDSVDITVTFGETVVFTANGGSLQATLSNGVTVTLANIDFNAMAVFANYTVVEGQTDSADLSVTALSLVGGATLVAQDDGLDADLSLPAGQNLGDTQNIVIDANTPTVAIPDLTAATDTGSSNSDNRTNNATPTIVGTTPTEPGATVSVRVGGAQVGTTTADGAGNWSYTFGAGQLSEGPNAVDIVASDAANTSADSADLTLTVDTSAPFLSAVDLVSASDTGTSNTDDLTADTTPTIQYTAVLGASIDIDWGDGNGFVAAAAGAGSAQQATLGTAYATDGAKTISVRATDAAGNQTTQSLAVTIDTTGNTPTLSAPATTGTATFTVTVDFGQTVTGFDAADITLGGVGGTVDSVTDQGSGRYAVSVTAAAEGTLTLDVAGAAATDAASNASVAPAQLTVTYSIPVAQTLIEIAPDPDPEPEVADNPPNPPIDTPEPPDTGSDDTGPGPAIPGSTPSSDNFIVSGSPLGGQPVSDAVNSVGGPPPFFSATPGGFGGLPGAPPFFSPMAVLIQGGAGLPTFGPAAAGLTGAGSTLFVFNPATGGWTAISGGGGLGGVSGGVGAGAGNGLEDGGLGEGLGAGAAGGPTVGAPDGAPTGEAGPAPAGDDGGPATDDDSEAPDGGPEAPTDGEDGEPEPTALAPFEGDAEAEEGLFLEALAAAGAGSAAPMGGGLGDALAREAGRFDAEAARLSAALAKVA